MLKAKDFKRLARESLKGRWLKAGFAGLIAGLLGASIGIDASFSGSGSSTGSASTTGTGELINFFTTGASEMKAALLFLVLAILLVALLWAVVTLIVGGAVTLGYAKYNLNLVDHKEAKLKDLFSQFDRLGTGFGMQFLRGLFIFLWSLLFLIPGVIAGYSYYMTPFILCEQPDMTAREAIKKSKMLMKGNKWRLFCLNLSFIGWEILGALIFGIIVLSITFPLMLSGGGIAENSAGILLAVTAMIVAILVFSVLITLFLSPYITASIAAFYREISEGRYSQPCIETTNDYQKQNYYNNYYDI